MSKSYLGEFEELVLLVVAMMKDQAYGLMVCEEIKNQINRSTSIGAVHATIDRLEKKGFVETFLGGSTKERGGRRKRLIRLTNEGRLILIKSRDEKLKMWTQIPELAI